jgi:predicted AAA+ superfamily ATPase
VQSECTIDARSTLLLRHLSADDRRYVTLDDLAVRDLARRDPVLFLQRYRPPILIDEIQYAPELLTAIKLDVDRARRPGAFWLTGSQQFAVMRGITETLAGRVAILTLAFLRVHSRFMRTAVSLNPEP